MRTLKLTLAVFLLSACNLLSPTSDSQVRSPENASKFSSTQDQAVMFINSIISVYDCDLREFYSINGNRVLHCRDFEFFKNDMNGDDEVVEYYDRNYELAVAQVNQFKKELRGTNLGFIEEISPSLQPTVVHFPNTYVDGFQDTGEYDFRFVVDRHNIYDEAGTALASHSALMIEVLSEDAVEAIDEARAAHPFY